MFLISISQKFNRILISTTVHALHTLKWYEVLMINIKKWKIVKGINLINVLFIAE